MEGVFRSSKNGLCLSRIGEYPEQKYMADDIDQPNETRRRFPAKEKIAI